MQEKSSSEKISTTSDAILAALQEAGVEYIFANFGSDHAGIIESLGKANTDGRATPKVLLCPHENVAITAAHGYSQVSSRAQAVFVHVDVGTQNLGGSLHNAYRGRVPVFIFAGLTPHTLEGELPGTRNRSANYFQDVFDQAGIVRQYVKWDYTVRTGKNVKQLVHRAIQIAESDPPGPVYLTAARETLEEEVAPSTFAVQNWKRIAPAALPEEGVEEICAALLKAEKPLLITSYSGRIPASVAELVRFCERLAIPVVEERPIHMNFPANHPLHMGYLSGPLIADADVIVVLDCDVPWLPASGDVPNAASKVFYVDVDPLKESIPLWYMPAQNFFKADATTALKQMNRYLDAAAPTDEGKRSARLARAQAKHDALRSAWAKKQVAPADGSITAEWVTTCLREVINDDTIIINESVTSTPAVYHNLARSKPGTLFGSGGSALGFGGGAAIGTKLAAPDKDVVCLTGDGSFFFGTPTAVYWAARRYNAPFLTIIFNNEGWNATKENFHRIHPSGAAAGAERDWVSLGPSSDFAKVAEGAGGALGLTVERADALMGVLEEAMSAVRGGRCAVVDVRLAAI